jgi:hypothetical protein
MDITLYPLSRSLPVQGLRFKHDLFCVCFTAGRQPHTHIRTPFAVEASPLFIAISTPLSVELMQLCGKDHLFLYLGTILFFASNQELLNRE